MTKRVANLEAEESLLGAMLLSREAIDAATEVVGAEHFYRTANADIFEAIVKVHSQREPVDPITVAHAMEQAGTLVGIGGSGVLVALLSDAPATSSARRYAEIVFDLAQTRAGQRAAREIVASADELPEDVDEWLARAERAFADIRAQTKDDELLFAFSDVDDELLDRYMSFVEGNRTALGPGTGLHCLDEILDGLAPGSLTIIGGRPGMGKTVLGAGIARHIAVDLGLASPFFTLEVPRIELAMRLTAAHCGVDYGRLKVGELHEREWDLMERYRPKLKDSPLFIVDDPHASVSSIDRVCRKLRREHEKLGVVVVDYVQLMEGSSDGEGRRVAVDQISRGLKILARDLECPVVAMAQLNRGLESRADKRPMLSDLRESGGLEQDADNVIFCYRDEVYDRETEDQGIIELIVAKHRTGKTGVARAAWLGHRQSIVDMAR